MEFVAFVVLVVLVVVVVVVDVVVEPPKANVVDPEQASLPVGQRVLLHGILVAIANAEQHVLCTVNVNGTL